MGTDGFFEFGTAAAAAAVRTVADRTTVIDFDFVMDRWHTTCDAISYFIPVDSKTDINNGVHYH